MFIGDIWKSLQRVFNFTYTVVPSIDGEWGSLLEDGSFNGMVGMVERSEVDVGISSFFLTTDRARVTDFSNIVLLAELVCL